MPNIFQSINPYNQEIIAEHALMSDADLATAMDKAAKTYQHWRKTSFDTRSQLLAKAAAILRTNKEEYAHLIATEMGKILNEARGEVEKCAINCDYYATRGEAILQDKIIETEARRSLVAYDPIGAIFAIMPWNFPFWQVFRFAAPSLMAGNVILLKHAPNVTGCAKAMEQVFLAAGFPEGAFQTLVVDIDKTEHIIAHDIVQGVTLTGSELAGSAVAALAGKHIKKSVLELGGSDPFIVLQDADIQRAAKVATQSRMQNAGQSCIASKRFFVMDAVYDDFVNAFANEVAAIKQGNQLDPATTMGPVARLDLATKLQSQLQSSLADNATLVIGGGHDACNVQATILADVRPGMAAFEEETFGPMANVIRVPNAEEAIRLANSNRYGLGASIWSSDLDRAYHLARQIDSGAVFVNSLVKSDSRLPFGGVKKSGYGRELGDYGMMEFCNMKTILLES